MADERVVHSFKLVDPTTTSQIAGVATLTDNFATPVAVAAGAFGMWYDGATWDFARGDATNGLLVNLGANNDVTVTSGSITADTELPAAAALSDTFANPTAPAVGAFLMGWDATDWARIWSIRDGDTVAAAAAGFLAFGSDGSNYVQLLTSASGALQVDVLSGAGSNTPSNPVAEGDSSSGTAAGASANLDTTDLGGETRELWQVDVTGSVPWKAEIGAYENGSLVESYTTLFGRAGEVVSWRPPHTDFTNEAFSANAGFDGYRVVWTNMDTSEAADGYASFFYADA